MRTLAWTCCAWLIVAGILQGEEAAKVLPPEIEQLVAEHEATWAKIETLDVEYQVTASIPIGPGPHRPKTGAGRWVRGEGFERLVAERIVDGPSGDEIVCLAEFSVIGRESRCLIREIDGSNDGKTYSDEYVRRQLASSAQPWMRQFAHELGGALTLRELATQWPTTLERTETGYQGDRIAMFKAMRPVEEGSPEAGSFVRVFLNLDKGCLVQRVDQFDTNGATKPRTPPEKPARFATGNVLLATDYLDCGEGIWFPAEVRGYLIPDCQPDDLHRTDDWMGIVQWKTISVRTNEPLDSTLGAPIVREASFANSFGSVPQPAILPIRR